MSNLTPALLPPFFFFNDTATTEIYTLSLPDALPICFHRHALASELLTQLGYRTAFVAVEFNGNIIKQADFGSTTITDADKLEIVSFVGGG